MQVLTYPNRTPNSTSEVELNIHSNSLIVNPDSVSKAIDPQTGELHISKIEGSETGANPRLSKHERREE